NFEAHHYATGHPGFEGNTLAWYLSYLWHFEGIVSLLAGLQIVRGILQRSRETLLLSAFAVGYFVFVSSYVVRDDRTILPVIPFLILLGSSFLVDLIGLRPADLARSRAWPGVLGLGLATMALVVPLRRTIIGSFQLIQVDSRTTARLWLNSNLPQGAKVA